MTNGARHKKTAPVRTETVLLLLATYAFTMSSAGNFVPRIM